MPISTAPIARKATGPDPYAWLQERDSAEVLDYLKAENAWQEAQLSDQQALHDGRINRAKQVVFEAVPMANGATAVKVQKVIEDPSPMKLVYDPKNPLADEKGYVTMPNVNTVDEMVNMLSASRSYQTNVETMNAAKSLLLKTLTLGQ